MRALLLALLLLPLAALAEVPAGFPSSSIWLSKTDLADGESVTIYTVVYNSTDESLSGSVTFLVDGTAIGQKDVSAAPGTTHILSHAWSATEGEHAFSARLAGDIEGLSETETATTSVTVAPKPPPPESVVKTVEAAGAIQAAIASSTPIVQSVASTTVSTAESIRQSAVSALERLQDTDEPEGEVLGAEDESASPEENAARSFDIGGWVHNAWQALIGALLFVARSPLWFYVAVAVVLFVLFQFMRTAMSDRRHRD